LQDYALSVVSAQFPFYRAMYCTFAKWSIYKSLKNNAHSLATQLHLSAARSLQQQEDPGPKSGLEFKEEFTGALARAW
jgi:hypothetical protein